MTRLVYGLKSLAEHYLKITPKEDKRIRASNWENEPLNERQIAYAANDVLTVMASLLVIVNTNYTLSALDQLLEKAYEICCQFKDRRFSKKFKSKSPAPMPPPAAPVKKVKNGHSILKKPLYDNSRLEAPDGQLLCVCDSKKALWYVSKNLGSHIRIPM